MVSSHEFGVDLRMGTQLMKNNSILGQTPTPVNLHAGDTCSRLVVLTSVEQSNRSELSFLDAPPPVSYAKML